MGQVKVASYREVEPRIYAYQVPGLPTHVGWTKIGEAWKQPVGERIAQQTRTVGVAVERYWDRPARFADEKGTLFHDRDFHAYLESEAVERMRSPETRQKLEWFRLNGEEALEHFERFVASGWAGAQKLDYALRAEQQAAVAKARAYFEAGGRDFLWNAKPRFGKTLAAYHLVREMGLKKVLVVTNRPAVSNSWADDFEKFVAWRGERVFVSDNEALSKHRAVISRASYLGLEAEVGFIAFESLQGLKGSCYLSHEGKFDKLRWMAEIDFDLLIIDEAHEGAETDKAEEVLEKLRAKARLHLSGTPFKQLSHGNFAPEQVYTWSYVDEQAAKAAWAGEEANPYEALPRLSMYTYQLSPMVEAEVRRGFDEEHRYAFDLAEFFSTKGDTFVYEDKVRAFLRSLSSQEKYPFSTPELRNELCHTLWLLNRVKSAKALKALLEEKGSGFEDYAIILAAGDGRGADEEETIVSEQALQRVRQAIKRHPKTITLSVGQLTVGVTVPEWNAILMLNTLKSPAAYFQATFRVQNPHMVERAGKVYMKEEAYVFDFDPTRTLTLFSDLANETLPDEGTPELSPSERRERRIRRLLNFYPVIGEDDEGRMVPLDVAEVLAIPARLKCQEVVRRGFMSDFLFQGLSGLFRNAAAYETILEKLPVAEDFHSAKKTEEAIGLKEVPVDAEGEVMVPPETVIGTAKELFGDKVYGTTEEVVAVATRNLPKRAAKAVAQQVQAGLESAVKTVEAEYNDRMTSARLAHVQVMEATPSEVERHALEATYAVEMKALEEERQEALAKAEAKYVATLPRVATELVLTAQAKEQKASAEKRVREHLRGFARTIPSFLMAYGEDGLTLANFDTYLEPEPFRELTGITLDEFRLLRDGGELNGKCVSGGLFDERVFNDAVKEFMSKRRALANFLDEAHGEDIFDYIPPQRTNQIFTPRRVVAAMVDVLERENPGCFDRPEATFADLYAKSGLYLAEIAKRLYRSPAMQAHFPDPVARREHIFTHQLFAMAPTRIIHRIVTNYLLGFDESLRNAAAPHIVHADAAQAAQNQSLQALVDRCFEC